VEPELRVAVALNAARVIELFAFAASRRAAMVASPVRVVSRPRRADIVYAG
jgi:hypothetical protein